jgi:hypothetical protein
MTLPDLKSIERASFRATADDGLWDLLLAAVVVLFAVAPLLSSSLGDFWSSAIFLPVWAAGYAAVVVVRRRVVSPRVGVMKFGPDRRRRLRRFSWTMLAVNFVMLGAGIAAALTTERGTGEGLIYPIALGVAALGFCSVSAFTLGIPRLFVYGVLLAGAPLVGEWLWRAGRASHHGFPVTFGVAAAAIAVTGTARFAQVLRRHPGPGPVPDLILDDE